ncbi:MAG: chromosomal replication initiator protein DnaA, partial [bacterium]|nr:chromosomal replication initiator protein DnaA [bacterium]
MNEELWSRTISQIKNSLPESEFSSWFSRIYFGTEDKGKVTLYVPSNFVKDRVDAVYRELIENTLSELGESEFTVVFEVRKDTQNQNNLKKTAESSKTETSEQQQDQKVQKPSKPSADDMMFNPAYTFDSFVPGDNSSFAYSACMAIAKNPGSA